jgi:hypothetical protein
MSKKNDPVGYIAKYVNKQRGGLHFGGTIDGVNFSEDIRSRLRRGKPRDVTVSDNLSHDFFHLREPRVRRQR